jgi:hypothetical protein
MIRTRMHFFEHSSFIDDRPGCHRNGPWKQTIEQATAAARSLLSPVGIIETERLSWIQVNRCCDERHVWALWVHGWLSQSCRRLSRQRSQSMLALPHHSLLPYRPTRTRCFARLELVSCACRSYGEDAVERAHAHAVECRCRERKVGCHGGCEHATRGAARCTAWPSRMVYSRRVRHMLLAPIATSLLPIHHFLCMHAPTIANSPLTCTN